MIFERTTYVPKPGLFDAVLATRHRACAMRREIGLAGGEVFVEEGEPALVHWECRFESAAAQAEDLARRGASPDFGAVREMMRDLVDGFERRVFQRSDAPDAVLRVRPMEGVPVAPEAVEIASGNLRLSGYLCLPPGPGPHPCMVINHGSGIHRGTTEWCRPGVMAMLMGWGVATLLTHRRGYGNSPGTPWREDVSAEYGTEAYDRQLAARLSEEAGDVVAALAYAEGHPELDPAHIGVMGSSFGGTVTLLAAADCPRFRCAVDFAGAAMNWERAPGLRALMLAAAERLSQPTCFIQAANDYSVAPTSELAAAARAAGRTHVEDRVFPAFGLTRDEGHFFYKEGTAVWGDHVRRFLERWL